MKLILLVFITFQLFAKDITMGATYPFNEKNAVKEIKDHIANNYNAIAQKTEEDRLSAIKKFKESYRPPNAIDLPCAKEDKEYFVDLTQELATDIKNVKGDILYPKGTKINPLHYVKLPYSIIVIDGTDKAQIAWFKNSAYANQITTQIHITKGRPWELSEELKRPVFFTNAILKDRFNLKAVPSIISQSGDKLKISLIKTGGSK